MESQQNDNISRSVGETSLKQKKLQKRSKSTKCYIHFHNFPESTAKNFNVVSHLQVSQIPKIKSKKGTGTWNPNRMTTFQGESPKVTQTRKTSKAIKINEMLYSFLLCFGYPFSASLYINQNKQIDQDDSFLN